MWVTDNALNEGAAAFIDKWPPAQDKWAEGPRRSPASINGGGISTGCRGIMLRRIISMPRGGQLRGERSSGCLKLGLDLLVSGEFSPWMSAPRVSEAKHKPRPSVLKAPVSSLAYLVIRGSES